MADPRTSTNDCGCCAGIDSETPRRIDNAPGLPAIGYRVGNHARFKESLLARLSGSDYPALRGLSTRADSDFTIALCDACATALDVLSFYQERIANEHYLRTATERRSVLEMARLIGYRLAPGVAASTHLAFALQETPGDASQAVAPVRIPPGTRVQSVPGQDEKPQTFETVEEAEARVEWNAMPVQANEAWQPAFGDTDLWLDGASNQLQPGDAILIVGAERRGNPTSERWDIRVLDRVEVDAAQSRTQVSWVDGLGRSGPQVDPAAAAVQVFVFRQRAALFGHNAPDPNLMGNDDSNVAQLIDTTTSTNWAWNNFTVDPRAVDLDIDNPKIGVGGWMALVSNHAYPGSAALPGYVELVRVQQVVHRSRNAYGLSGKITRITPDAPAQILPNRFGLRRTLVLAQSEELKAIPRPLTHPVFGDRLALERRVEGLAPGRALAVSGRRQRIAVAAGVNDLHLDLDAGGSVSLSEGDSLELSGHPMRLLGGSSVALTPEEFRDALGGEVRLRLSVEDRDGRTGSLTVWAFEIHLQASRKDDRQVMEIAFIAPVPSAVSQERDRTSLKFTAPLKHCYERVGMRVNANVARATHGETVQELLGGTDARLPDQSFVLRQPPLTYVSADTPSGSAAPLSLRLNDQLWGEVPSLYGEPADARVYALAVDDDGITSVRFGDGVEGARPPSGQNNVRAVYRKGLGLAGNVAAGKLTTLLSRPLGVSAATNPVAASGGEDAESLERARVNAPLTVLTLNRAVSVKDYADFAHAFAGIDKAHALWLPAGPGRGVFLTVSGIEGAVVPEDGDTYRNLLAALKAYGDPLIPLRLVNYRPAVFRLRLAAKVAGTYETGKVLRALEDALRLAFGFSRRAFGQGVSLDEVMAVAHGVDGVEAVHVSELYRPAPGVTPTRQQRLSAALPVPAVEGPPEAAELLTLAGDPLELEELP